MAIIRNLEVRLKALRGGEYFGEHALPGEADTDRVKIRYIVPESGPYGIEIKFKPGYTSGKYDGGLGIKIIDKASEKILLNEEMPKKNRVVLIKSLPNVIVDGQRKKNVNLSFYDLVPGTYKLFPKILVCADMS